MSSDQDITMKDNNDTKQKPSNSEDNKSTKEKEKQTNSSKKSHKKSRKSDKDTKKSSKLKSSKSSKRDKDKTKDNEKEIETNKLRPKIGEKDKDKNKSSSSSKKDKSKKKESNKTKEDKPKEKRKRKRSITPSHSRSPSRSRDHKRKRSRSRSRSRSPSRHKYSRYSRSPSYRSYRRHRRDRSRDRRRRRYKRSRRYHSRSTSRSNSRSKSSSRSPSDKPVIPKINPQPVTVTSDMVPDINNPNGSKVAEIKATAPNAMQQLNNHGQQRSIANPLAAFNAVFGNLTRPAVLALTNPLQQSNATLQQLLSGTNPYKLNLGLSGNANNINPLLMNKMVAELRNSAIDQQTKSAAAKLSEVNAAKNGSINDSTDSKTTDDSLFFQVHLPGMNTLTAIGGIHPQITRPARRLYVGNLPVGMGLTEQILTEFFSQCCKGLGIATVNPVLSVWLNSEQTFGFIEFRSVQDTNLALQLFEGLQLGGRQLRFGRPVDYKQPPDNLKNYVVGETGNGGSSNGSHIEAGSPAAMLIAQQQQQEAALNNGIGMQQDMAKKTLDAAISTKQKAMMDAMMDGKDVSMKDKDAGCCILLLMNMINEDDIKEEDEYNDILDDIECECENYGNLLEVVIPRIGEKGCGRVFLKFEKVMDAKKCKSKVDGRKFGENVVRCVYFKEELFNEKEYGYKVD